MRISRLILAAAAVLSIALTNNAIAGQPGSHAVTQYCGDRPCPTFGAPPQGKLAQRHAGSRRVAAGHPRHRAREAALPLAERTLSGYGAEPADAPPSARAGLITVDTCAGVQITVAPSFAPNIQAWICEQVSRGVQFLTIRCAARGGHVPNSLHYSGNACDHRYKGPIRPTWRTAGDHGLRDGCSFLIGRNGHRRPDCGHIDNAFSFGWPYVRTGSQPRRTTVARQ